MEIHLEFFFGIFTNLEIQLEVFFPGKGKGKRGPYLHQRQRLLMWAVMPMYRDTSEATSELCGRCEAPGSCTGARCCC